MKDGRAANGESPTANRENATRREAHSSELRFITYLSPGIPEKYFEAVADHIGRELGVKISLRAETGLSGPPKGSDDPFSRGGADIGFMCAPPFLWLRERDEPPVELVGAAPVFRDDRANGEPVYFSEVVVDALRGIENVSDVRTWAYNDPCSLSGFYSLLQKVGDTSGMVCSGSHPESIKKILAGEVDAASVDSNALRMAFIKKPSLRNRLRVIEWWGPHPIQPVAVRSNLPDEIKKSILAALLSIGSDTAPPEFGLEGFAPVGYEHYAAEKLTPSPLE
ncbi:MAG: phosphate/phosphite/phosphonate ABC transporter substrate-binding protein [Actinomycetota bacterium]|nr:PhnD/SsuA/transferrin family substrate-binding protein [Rubrobacter sp.]MDQ3509696.1 phosphate/phosphite/phosphonate ABC transporter substrate-binding protein [Actinomycetota bacterium]